MEAPVAGQEVVDGIYKFDFPFLADKRVVWETPSMPSWPSIPNLKVRYIYTGPSELNSKKKTHLLRLHGTGLNVGPSPGTGPLHRVEPKTALQPNPRTAGTCHA